MNNIKIQGVMINDTHTDGIYIGEDAYPLGDFLPTVNPADTNTHVIYNNNCIGRIPFSFRDLNNQTSYKFIDISSEIYREYTFLGRGSIRIDNPVAIAVSKSGHRIFDDRGICHFIPAEWQQIVWLTKAGQPHFVK